MRESHGERPTLGDIKQLVGMLSGRNALIGAGIVLGINLLNGNVSHIVHSDTYNASIEHCASDGLTDHERIVKDLPGACKPVENKIEKANNGHYILPTATEFEDNKTLSPVRKSLKIGGFMLVVGYFGAFCSSGKRREES